MQRASRSAGVRPALGMQSHILRSLAISLAIVLVTIRSPAHGFTLRKIEASVDTPLEVENLLQNAAKDLHSSHNGTNVGSEALTTIDETGTTSKVNLVANTTNISNPTVTEKDPVDTTTTTADKSTTIENNTTSPIIIDETLKQEINNYESTTNIVKISGIILTEKEVTTVATQNGLSSEHGTTITNENLTTINQLDAYDVTQPVSTVSTIDITVSKDTTTAVPVSSTMEYLKETTIENETSPNKYNTATLNSLNSAADESEVATDFNAVLITTTKFDELLPITQESTTNKINNEVLSTPNGKSEPTSITENLNTMVPTESISNLAVIDQKPFVTTDDNRDSQKVFTEPLSDNVMSASTIFTSVTEFDKKSLSTSNKEHSTIFDETSYTVQGPLPTKVSTGKTVGMDLTTAVPTSSILNNKPVQVTIMDFNTNTTEVYLDEKPTTTTEYVNTEILHADTTGTKIDKLDTYETTMPNWKQYVTIDRNHSSTSTEKITRSDSEMVGAKAETISLDKLLTNTPISSLLQLKNDLLKNHDSTTTFETTTTTEASTKGTPEPKQKNESKQIETHTTLDIVTSKRAGYIDNTATTTPPHSTMVFVNKATSTEVGLYGQIYDTESSEPELKSTTNLGSQSRLAEDAMKEELLIEKVLREQDYMQDTHDDPPGNKAPVRLNESAPNQEAPPPKSEVVTEDTLSVKPIKKKVTNLYTVNSNYKPLKKLDVQPAKQFVRDPDDNSWRNESISSLGIVFKPKNASKSFTEVLKNKTTELSNMAENNKSNVPDLRVRLEKIAEVRKSKKKKINMYGDTVYSDYEESSKEGSKESSKENSKEGSKDGSKESLKEGSNSSVEKVTSPLTPIEKTTSQPQLPLNTACDEMENYIQKDRLKQLKEELARPNKNIDIYDESDEYDADYVTKIDLKKFRVPFRNKNIFTTAPPINYMTEKTELYTLFPDRQPTVQYFPPTKKVKTSTTSKVYESDYGNLKNPFIYKEPSKTVYSEPFDPTPPVQPDRYENPRHKTGNPLQPPAHNVNKNLFLRNRPQGGFVSDDETYDVKPTYLIKHYREETEKDESQDYVPLTEAPYQGVTINDIDKFSPTKPVDYDYDGQFRRDIVHRFVDNFNQNSDKFKVDFPILYNNSVVHRTVEGGKVLASSSTFVKRLYESTKTPSFLTDLKPCDAHCENMKTVDLTPEYELHYYVPDQEEKEEVKPQPAVFPFQFRL